MSLPPGRDLGSGGTAVVGRMAAIWFAPYSVNQRLPSGAAAIPRGRLPRVGTGYSVKAPRVVSRPMLLPKNSVNHRLPSAPAVMPLGLPKTFGTSYSVMVPVSVILPILF